jgi:hypothetical protein
VTRWPPVDAAAIVQLAFPFTTATLAQSTADPSVNVTDPGGDVLPVTVAATMAVTRTDCAPPAAAVTVVAVGVDVPA